MQVQGMPVVWHLGTHKELGIDFCIWILRIGGFHVAPFDTHPVGKSSVPLPGLTNDDWRLWFHAVIAKDKEMRAIKDFATIGSYDIT